MSSPSLLPGVQGRIRRVLVTIPYWVLRYGHQVEIRPYRDAYAALLGSLPDRVERVVVTHAESVGRAESLLAELGLAGRARVVSVDDGTEFTVWGQDASVVQRKPEGGERLLVPAVFDRHDDAAVLSTAAANLGLEVIPTDLIFQGGNVLVGDDFWLLGADALRHTVLAGLADSLEEAERSFSEVFDPARRLVVVGSDLLVPESEKRVFSHRGSDWVEHIRQGSQQESSQPLFDLDTFISLAGRDEDGRYRLLVGDPRMAADLSGAPVLDHALAEVFDDVAEALARQGFRVIRNPLPLVFSDDDVLRTRHWYFATSNNVIAEVHESDRRVWLPTYGDDEYPELREADRMNVEIWRRLGFEVEALPSFHAFARGLGAARCASKVLSR